MSSVSSLGNILYSTQYSTVLDCVGGRNFSPLQISNTRYSCPDFSWRKFVDTDSAIVSSYVHVQDRTGTFSVLCASTCMVQLKL